MHLCTVCFYTWRSTEPDYATSAEALSSRFRIDPSRLRRRTGMPEVRRSAMLSENMGGWIGEGRHRQGRRRIDGLNRRRRARRPRGRSVRAGSWRRSRADRRHEQGAARPRQERWLRADRPHQARSPGEFVADVLGIPEVDCAIDCVGFEAKAQGKDGQVIQAPAVVLNSLMMEITSAIGFPGLYVTDDSGAKKQAAKHGNLSLRLGLGWSRGPRPPHR